MHYRIHTHLYFIPFFGKRKQQRPCQSILPKALLLAGWSATPLSAQWSEVLADPTHLPDSLGEYLEFHPPCGYSDSCPVTLVLDQDTLFSGEVPNCEFILVGGPDPGNGCRLALKPSLSNTRSHSLLLYTPELGLVDSTLVPAALPGVSWERVSSHWLAAQDSLPWDQLGTPGACSPTLLPERCPSPVLPRLQPNSQNPITFSNILPDSLACTLLSPSDSLSLVLGPNETTPAQPWAKIQCTHNHSPLPWDKTWDTVVWTGPPPLAISEVHANESDSDPEWIELFNQSGRAIDISQVHLCGQKNSLPQEAWPNQSHILWTQDSAAFREHWGTSMSTRQIPWQRLADAADTIRLCWSTVPIDSLLWHNSLPDSQTIAPPQATGQDPSPGFSRPPSLHRAQLLGPRNTGPGPILFCRRGGEGECQLKLSNNKETFHARFSQDGDCLEFSWRQPMEQGELFHASLLCLHSKDAWYGIQSR